jgi:hypothetical protein
MQPLMEQLKGRILLGSDFSSKVVEDIELLIRKSDSISIKAEEPITIEFPPYYLDGTKVTYPRSRKMTKDDINKEMSRRIFRWLKEKEIFVNKYRPVVYRVTRNKIKCYLSTGV